MRCEWYRPKVLTSLTDVFIVAVLIVINRLNFIPHMKRGFHCGDESINYKFTGDSMPIIGIFATICIPFFMIWLAEAIFYQPRYVKSTRLIQSLSRSLLWFRYYMIGMILHLLLCDTIKELVGELRPHFLDTCKPDKAINCSVGDFITDYTCTNHIDSQLFILDSAKSFPSGHSSISFFEAIFVIWYVHRRVPPLQIKMLVPTLQTALLLWACLCSFSRIVDHRHHWWDVLLGAMFGIIFCVWTCIVLCNDFRETPIENIEKVNIEYRSKSLWRLPTNI